LRPSLAISNVLYCLLLAPVSGANASQIGNLWIVDASVPDVLQTQTVQIPATLTTSGRFQYEIGFSTQEQAAFGTLFDSLTLTLARSDGSNAANIATGDVFGLSIEPISTGGLLDGGAINAQQVAARTALLLNPNIEFAYLIEVSLPPALTGSDLTTTFSFFNNGDEIPTKAYAVVIPEPQPVALIATACAIGLLFRLHRKRASI
jgi:hypothetical protein